MSAFLTGKAVPRALTVHILLLEITLCALGVLARIHYLSCNFASCKPILPAEVTTFSGP